MGRIEKTLGFAVDRGAVEASTTELLAALEPFALDIKETVPDDTLIETVAWTAGQHRAARTAIARARGEQSK